MMSFKCLAKKHALVDWLCGPSGRFMEVQATTVGLFDIFKSWGICFRNRLNEHMTRAWGQRDSDSSESITHMC